jgi:ADP-ribose pyrophosphatase YjhB (NUDIX family)
MWMTFCPKCGQSMQKPAARKQACGGCPFINYNNPVPVTATLIPVDDGVVLVRRNAPPFVGDWCLPRGFMEQDERPKASARREVFEETGLWVRVDRMIALCNPSPPHFELNQITAFYLAHVEHGELKAGDDAQDVGVFTKDNLPNICFRTDQMIVADHFACRLAPEYEPTAEMEEAMRTIAVLEGMGTIEALQVLQKLAAGLPGARLTEDARASLSRLGRG